MELLSKEKMVKRRSFLGASRFQFPAGIKERKQKRIINKKDINTLNSLKMVSKMVHSRRKRVVLRRKPSDTTLDIKTTAHYYPECISPNHPPNIIPLPNLLTTSDVAKILGVSPNSVKRWAESGLIASQKTVGGHRRFRRDVVLKFLDSMEVNPSPIQTRIEEFIKKVLRSEKVSHVTGELLELREELGSWWRVAEFLGQVLQEVGENWENQVLTVDEEHYFSQQLTQALLFFFNQLFPSPSRSICLLATPHDESHHLGLRLAELCVREVGLQSIWLGQLDDPTQALTQHLENQKVEFLVLSASCYQSNQKEMAQLARNLELACHQQKIYLVLGGTGAWPEVLTYGHRIKDFEAFHRFLMEKKS